MHGLAHRIVATERERDVAYSAAHVHGRHARLDRGGGLDEVEAVAVVFLDAGGDGEDVGVEDDVLGSHPHRLGEQLIGPLANPDLALDRVGLPLLVESHDHDRGAVAHDLAGMLEEHLLAFLQADRVHDRLALHALQTRFDHRPFGGIEHHRHARDIGLAGDQPQKFLHGCRRVEHALVHVHVDDLRTARHLLAGDVDCRGVISRLDQLAKLRGTGDVGTLADVDEEAGHRW